jgi:hypothetical protein
MDKLPAGIRNKLLRKQSTKGDDSNNSTAPGTPLESGAETQIPTPRISVDSYPFPTTDLDECLACHNPCTPEEIATYPKYIAKSIDRETPLAGSVKPYGRHLLVSTGKLDWIHSIDEEDGSVVQGLHRGLYDAKYGGRKRDGEARIVLSNTSFAPSKIGSGITEVLVMPEWRMIRNVTPDSGVEFVRRFVDNTGAVAGDDKLLSTTLPWHSLVLICSHNKRDKRCGVTSKYLVKAFESGLRRRDIYRAFDDTRTEAQGAIAGGGTVLGCLSHIGGHKFAGNVIVYRRRTKSVDQLHEKLKELKLSDGKGEVTTDGAEQRGNGDGNTDNAKNGNAIPHVTAEDVQAEGIWLGRVEPKHVEAIIEEVILKGHIFKELYRGGLPSKYANLQF